MPQVENRHPGVRRSATFNKQGLIALNFSGNAEAFSGLSLSLASHFFSQNRFKSHRVTLGYHPLWIRVPGPVSPSHPQDRPKSSMRQTPVCCPGSHGSPSRPCFAIGLCHHFKSRLKSFAFPHFNGMLFNHQRGTSASWSCLCLWHQ